MWQVVTGARYAAVRHTDCLLRSGPMSRNESRKSGEPPRRVALTWCFTWQPVRDSNPCRHLERASWTVRLVLSDAVLCGLSRTNATRRVASCRPVSASTAAWSGKWIGKTSCRGGECARPPVRPATDQLAGLRPIAEREMRAAVSRIVGTKRSGLNRFLGPEIDTAATARDPEASKTGAATQVRPSCASSLSNAILLLPA